MMKNSSNDIVENNLDLLEGIKRVSPSEHLYQDILNRIAEQRTNTVSTKWIAAAAAVLILFVALDFIAIERDNRQQNRIESTFSELTTNNQLYYD